MNEYESLKARFLIDLIRNVFLLVGFAFFVIVVFSWLNKHNSTNSESRDQLERVRFVDVELNVVCYYKSSCIKLSKEEIEKLGSR
jgi:uncharacterized membrane protein